MRFPDFNRFLLALFCGAVLSGTAAAQMVNRTFVASYGNDANDCSFNTPCRNFSGAILKTNEGGEIIALNSAGFGPNLTIDKSISIIVPTGIYGGMTTIFCDGVWRCETPSH